MTKERERAKINNGAKFELEEENISSNHNHVHFRGKN